MNFTGMTVTRVAATVTRVAGLALLAFVALVRPLSAEPPVTDFRLDNGMQVVVIEDHRSATVTHMVWYPVGAADEPWGRSGIAHLLEHLMFMATDELEAGEFSRIVTANGGSGNAFTGHDYTGYFQRIAADRLGLMMSMEADRMGDLRLTEEVVATERDVVLEERSQRSDNNPQALFGEQMGAALYMNHPYGIPVVGWRHEIEELSLEDARSFYERYYAPDNAILVVAGDVTPEEVRELAEEHYGKRAPSGRPPEARPQEPPHRAPRRIEMRDARVSQPVVNRTYLVPAYDPANPREAAALEILGDLLGSGITSQFAKTLEIEKEMAIETGAYYSSSRRDATEFGIWAVPAEGRSLAEVEAELDAVIARFIAEGPDQQALERAKRLVRAGLIYAQDNQTSLARRYGAGLAIGQTVEDVRNWPDVLADITAEEVRAAAETFLVPERSVTGWLMRDGETES